MSPKWWRLRLERLRGARGDTTATVETGADVDASPSCPRSGGVFDWKGCVARAGTRLQWSKLEPMWTLARHVPEVGASSIGKVAWRARGHDCNGRNWSRCGR